MKAATENYIIQTVSRALELLEQFKEGDAEFGITDLSKDYIEINNSTGKYRLGIKTRALGQLARLQADFADHARPFLSELQRKSHESCYFSIIKDQYNYYLDCVESDLPVQVARRVGSSKPLYLSAAGRVQLAYMEPHKQRELLSYSEMRQLIVGNLDVLQNELNRVAQKGYAIDDQEQDAGVMEIAAPVFDSNGAIIGSLSILGPEMRLAGSRLKNDLLPLLCQSASRFSSTLGYCSTRNVEKTGS